MTPTMYLELLVYEKRLNKKFVKALRTQGHSWSDVFSILLDLEYQRRPGWSPRVSMAIRQGAVNGYFYFERDEDNHWVIYLTELGHHRFLGLDES